MQAKIEWYKEILELDPSSKVFFPLAKLLADAGQVQEAMEILREGAVRHPDFLEARFFCMELCARIGDEEGVAEEAGVIGDVLGRYPLFWKAWAQNLSRTPETRDAALALDFVSVHFQGNPVSWGEVIQRGLEGLFQSSQTNLPFSGETGQFLKQGAPEAALPSPPQGQTLIIPANEPELVVEQAEPEPQHQDIIVEHASEAPAKPAEDVYSIRTRTMARLLAEQGDYAGALEIYQELLGKATDDAECEELDAIIERMQVMLREMPKPQAPAQPEEGAVSRVGKSVQDAVAPRPSHPASAPPKAPEPIDPTIEPADDQWTAAPAPVAQEQLGDVPEGAAPSVPPVPAIARDVTPQESAVNSEQVLAQEEDAVAPPPKETGATPPKKRPRSAMERLALRLERRAAAS